uniref:cGMP-dependent protein kinase n=1 Tax=Ditylum brightwellii TaxID=49249 RepID=A0A7S1ZND8_9STRA|mmetsp:Transcript_35667/g.53159  ORF Transcript_35667/g.53159 Transcript_35667/m.53159 type:complete len:929 (+) Transcript_35667:26-2812(+)
MSESKNRNDNSGELDGPSGARARKRQSGVQRVKLSRTKTEAHNMKLNKMTLHAKLTGSQKSQSRHGEIFAAIDVEHLVKPSLNPNTKKTEQDIRFIEETLTDGENFVFEFISHEHRTELIKHMECICVRKDGVIIRQGDEGDYFYVIKEGAIDVYVSEEQQNQDYNTPQDLSLGQSDVDGNDPSSSAKRGVFALNRSDMNKESFGAESCVGSPQCQENHNGTKHRKTMISLDHDLSAIKRSPISVNQDDTAPSSLSASSSLDANEKLVCELGPGDSFGELALLYNCPRMATCVAKKSCSMWRVDLCAFRRIMSGVHSKQSSSTNEFDALEALKKVTILSDVLDEPALARMANALIPIKFKCGEKLCIKGEVGDTMHIISSGEVLIHNIGLGDSQFKDIKAGPGDFFGERSLLSDKAGETRSADITATSDTVVTLVMSKEQFETKLGSLKDIMRLALLQKKLMTISSFATSGLEPFQFNMLTKSAKEVEFEAGHVIAIAGKPTMPALYLILSGTVQISDEQKGTVNVLGKEDHFGTRILHVSQIVNNDDPTAEVSTPLTIEVMEPTKCAILTREAIEQVIGSISRLGKPSAPIAAKLNRNIQMDDLKKHRILGIGSFGSVWLVEHKEEKSASIYALKVMRKRDILQHKMTKHVIREKNIMISVDHPFIINLVATFQDASSLYMLENFIPGGELFTVIHKPESDGIPNEAARFYCACVTESLAHLHKRNICFRDLKPENILIDRDGYCILIDLGFAKLVLNKTHTMCGTPEYLSPELILHKGHNKEVDHWALGILLYEMIVGQSPFASPGLAEVKMFRKIVNAKFPFPDQRRHGIDVTDKAKDVIARLLTKNPSERLGSLAGGDDDIKNHPYFENIFKNNDLVRKKIKAPWLPQIKNALDASNFETYRNDDHQYLGKKLTTSEQSLFEEF